MSNEGFSGCYPSVVLTCYFFFSLSTVDKNNWKSLQRKINLSSSSGYFVIFFAFFLIQLSMFPHLSLFQFQVLLCGCYYFTLLVSLPPPPFSRISLSLSLSLSLSSFHFSVLLFACSHPPLFSFYLSLVSSRPSPMTGMIPWLSPGCVFWLNGVTILIDLRKVCEMAM